MPSIIEDRSVRSTVKVSADIRRQVRANAGWVLFCLTAILLSSLLSRPFSVPDETRYISVAWEMWRDGHWLVPIKNGLPYSHKPPLLFWLIEGGWALFGVNAISPLLTVFGFSLATCALVYRFALRLWQAPLAGSLAAVVLSSTLLWSVYSGYLMFDIILSFWVTLALYGMVLVADGVRRGWWWWILGTGLGLLTKGPAVFIYLLMIPILAPLWSKVAPYGQWKRWYLAILGATLGGGAIVLSWAVPAALQGGEQYGEMLFWGQTAGRMVESFAHQRPVWWFLAAAPLLLFPWILWGGFWRNLRHAGSDRGVRLLAVWILGSLLIWSLISGKQPHYLMPTLPALALLVGWILTRAEQAGVMPRRAQQWGIAAAWILLGLALVLLPIFARHGNESPISAIEHLWGLPLILIGLFLAWWRPASLSRLAVGLALTTIAGLVVINSGLMASFWRYYDPSEPARYIARLQQQGIAVAHIGKYDDYYHFAGRLQQSLVTFEHSSERAAWMQAHPDGYLVDYFRPGDPTLAQLVAAGAYHHGFKTKVVVIVPVAKAPSP